MSLSFLVTPNAHWTQQANTVASGHRQGDGLKQISNSCGLVVDDDDTVFIADHWNDRILAWKKGHNKGHLVASGQAKANGLHQLKQPTDVLIEEKSNSLIICDYVNRRIVRWPLQNGTRGEVLIDNISCWGLTMDKPGCLYVSDARQHEVRRFTRGDTKGIVVAGGDGQGSNLNQLTTHCNIFVDEEQSLYVSDWNNHRVMKWTKGGERRNTSSWWKRTR
jgi:hypothetical protein